MPQRALIALQSLSSIRLEPNLFTTNMCHNQLLNPSHLQGVAQVNPFNIMMNARVNYAFLPPMLSHKRMYTNHNIYNELIEFLEKHSLGWIKDMSSNVGKRFVEVMSNALFKCGLAA